MRLFLAVLLAFVSAICPVLTLPALAEERWTEVSSPHFRVLTDGSVADGRKVAVEFEEMRYVLHWRFPEARLDPNKPFLIVAARTESTAARLLPLAWKQTNGKSAGMFISGWDRNLTLVRLDTWSSGAREVVYHEYTHSVLHLNAHWLPTWLDEGMAEFFAYSQFRPDRIVIGSPTQRWRALDRRTMVPVRDLVTVRGVDFRSDTSMQTFYAESWAMVHFMTFGPGMEGGKLLGDFYGRLQSGTDQKTAFTAVFGDPDAFQERFYRYLENFLLTAGSIPPAPASDVSSFTDRVLPPAEALLRLGQFHTTSGDPEGGRVLLKQALALNPKLPGVLEELGFLDMSEGRLEQARKEWADALGLDASLSRSQFALTMTGSLLKEQTPEQRLATLEVLRKVLHADPKFAGAYAQLALLFWWQGDLDAALRASAEAERMEPWRSGYRMLTARLLLAKGKGREAAAIARQTADRYRKTDRYEAVEFWQEIPAGDRDEGPPLTLDLPPGTVMRHGTVTKLECGEAQGQGPKARIWFEPIEQARGEAIKGEPVEVAVPGYGYSGATDTLWLGGGQPTLCQQRPGQAVMVAYKPTGGKGAELVWVDLAEQYPGVPRKSGGQESASMDR